jgi:hypothetical protein
MMKRNLIVLLAAALLLSVVYGCYPMHSGHAAAQRHCCVTAPQSGAAAQADVQDVQRDVLYSCDCGAGCDCNSVSKIAGNCRCGKPMAWGHVVKVEGNEALLCTCGEGCTCQQDAANPDQCAGGKPLKRVNLAGTGLFFCNCGGSCTCNTVAAVAGQCKCGMPLKQR